MRLRYPTLWLAVLCCLRPGLLTAQTLPFGISLPPALNFATSPSPVGSGARAQGKGLAFIAIADDATAASHNPGGLVQLERPEVSIVGSYFLRVERQEVTQPDTTVDGQTLDSLDLNYLSMVYPFELWQKNVVVSLNVQRLFDLQGATDVTSRFTSIDGLQTVHARQQGALFTISPAVAVQITPAFSVGAAFNIWPGLFDNGWKQEVTVAANGFVPSGGRAVPFTAAGRLTEQFEIEGFNVTAGFLWAINPTLSLGGVFRSPFTARVTHTHTSTLTVSLRDSPEPVVTGNRFRDRLDLDMPLSYGLGLAARLSDHLTLALDVSRTHWSDFRLHASTRQDVLVVENGAPSGKGRAVLNGEANDVTSVRLGAEYLWIRPGMLIPLRAGVFYDPEPGDGGTDAFFGFSLGTGMTFRSLVFDLAYTFRTGSVRGEATDTTVFHHGALASVIYHF